MMKPHALTFFAVFLVTSCANQLGEQASGFSGLELQLKRSGDTNKQARSVLSEAMKEVELAQADAQAARDLVNDMNAQASPYAGDVDRLRISYENRMRELQRHIEATNAILEQQWQELELTQQQLAFVHGELALVQSNNKALQKRMASLANEKHRIEQERDDWRLKHAKLAKYRWAVFGTIAVFALGVVAKFRGIFF